MKAYDRFRVNSVSPTRDCYVRTGGSHIRDRVDIVLTDSNRGYHFEVHMTRDEASDLVNELTSLLQELQKKGAAS